MAPVVEQALQRIVQAVFLRQLEQPTNKVLGWTTFSIINKRAKKKVFARFSPKMDINSEQLLTFLRSALHYLFDPDQLRRSPLSRRMDADLA